MTYASVSVALLAEVASPGTWIYWLTIAGPILAEGRKSGYGHVVPFFVGGLLGFYGAALFSLCLLAWGAGLHKRFKQHLFLVANILLLLMGISYLVRAYLGKVEEEVSGARCQRSNSNLRLRHPNFEFHIFYFAFALAPDTLLLLFRQHLHLIRGNLHIHRFRLAGQAFWYA